MKLTYSTAYNRPQISARAPYGLEEEPEKTSAASKSLMHCNFFLTNCYVPGMFDVCFINLLLMYRDTPA